MTNKVINIKGDKIYVNETEYIPLSQSNFSTMHNLFSGRDCLWEITLSKEQYVKGFIVEVVDYYSEETDQFKEQKLKKSNIFFHFRNLEWKELRRVLSINQKSDLLNVLCQEDRDEYNRSLEASNRSPLEINKRQEQPFIKPKRTLIDEKINNPKEELNKPIEIPPKMVLHISIDELTFEDGRVHFNRDFYFLDDDISLVVDHEHLKPEFQYLKSYIKKIFDTNTFRFNVFLDKDEDSNVFVSDVISPDILAFNESFIKQVKGAIVQEVLQLSDDKKGNKVFSLNDFFSQEKEEKSSSNIPIELDEFVPLVLEHLSIRNEKCIDYLCKQQVSEIKPFFSVKPYYGLVFFIKGAERQYCCWELFDNNATYIWWLNDLQDFSVLSEKVANTIALIMDVGRNTYLRSVKDERMSFKRIFHSKINFNTVQSFKGWKEEIERVVV